MDTHFRELISRKLQNISDNLDFMIRFDTLIYLSFLENYSIHLSVIPFLLIHPEKERKVAQRGPHYSRLMVWHKHNSSTKKIV